MPRRKKVVVVGGGTAGIVIAKNLRDRFDVVVVEKSRYRRYPLMYGIPLMIGLLFRNRKLDYILSREIAVSSNRSIPFFESNMLGGASVMNGCVHTLGSERLWERLLSRFNASYADAQKSFDEIYSYVRNRKCIRLSLVPIGAVDKAFFRALARIGLTHENMGEANKPGFGAIHVTLKKVFRTSVLSLPWHKRVQVLMNEMVVGIRFDDNGQVRGVLTDKQEVDADYVILSGGVIGTCELMLKAQNDHKYNGREVLVGLPVGKGIKDHTNLRVNVFTNRKIGSLNEVDGNYASKIFLLLKHLVGAKTYMMGTGGSSTVHLDLDDDGVIDTRINVVNFTESGRHGSNGRFFDEKPGFSLSITAVSPKSFGEITHGEDRNRLSPGYLSNSQDVDLLKKALRFCLDILNTSPLSDLVQEVVDRDLIEGNPDRYISANYYSGHHLIGGMQSLVDKDFRVNNAVGLYACDASVMGEYVASNIHSTVVLLADVFSKKFTV